MSFLDKLNWRYATKKFDTNKKVSDSDKNKILEAIRMAPTSNGYQPFHIHIVEDKKLREDLKVAAYNQAQITDAPFLLVFSADADVPKRIDDYAKLFSGMDAENLKGLMAYLDNSKKRFVSMPKESAIAWSAKQAYIALGFGLAACAELEIDSCPMEGFDPVAFKKILNLPENLYPQAALAVGYRAGDDAAAGRPKTRFPKEELFETK